MKISTSDCKNKHVHEIYNLWNVILGLVIGIVARRYHEGVHPSQKTRWSPIRPFGILADQKPKRAFQVIFL